MCSSSTQLDGDGPSAARQGARVDGAACQESHLPALCPALLATAHRPRCSLLPHPAPLAGKKGKLPWWSASGWATAARVGSTGTLSTQAQRDAAKQAAREAAAKGTGGDAGAAGGTAAGDAGDGKGTAIGTGAATGQGTGREGAGAAGAG